MFFKNFGYECFFIEDFHFCGFDLYKCVICRVFRQ